MASNASCRFTAYNDKVQYIIYKNKNKNEINVHSYFFYGFTLIMSALKLMETVTNVKMVMNQKTDLSDISKFHVEVTSKPVRNLRTANQPKIYQIMTATC